MKLRDCCYTAEKSNFIGTWFSKKYNTFRCVCVCSPLFGMKFWNQFKSSFSKDEIWVSFESYANRIKSPPFDNVKDGWFGYLDRFIFFHNSWCEFRVIRHVSAGPYDTYSLTYLLTYSPSYSLHCIALHLRTWALHAHAHVYAHSNSKARKNKKANHPLHTSKRTYGPAHKHTQRSIVAALHK